MSSKYEYYLKKMFLKIVEVIEEYLKNEILNADSNVKELKDAKISKS